MAKNKTNSYIGNIFFTVFFAIVSYLYLGVFGARNNYEIWSKDWLIFYFLYPLIGVLLFLGLRFFLIKIGTVPAIFIQFRKSKIWGLWQDSSLDKQIIKNFLKAEEIKVKLTRGYNTFCKENEGFYRILTEKFLKQISEREGQRRLKVLLHFPCHNSEHIESRSEVHNVQESKYLKTFHETIQKLLSINEKYPNKILVKLRFYGDLHYKWRFFVFQKSATRKILFINHYDSKRAGIKSPMLKIYNNATLCDDFDSTFDEIFSEYSFSLKEIMEFSSSQLREKLGCRNESGKCDSCALDFYEKLKSYQ